MDDLTTTSVDAQVTELAAKVEAAKTELDQLRARQANEREDMLRKKRFEILSDVSPVVLEALEPIWDDLKAVGVTGLLVEEMDDGTLTIIHRTGKPNRATTSNGGGRAGRLQAYFDKVATEEEKATLKRIIEDMKAGKLGRAHDYNWKKKIALREGYESS